MTAINSKHTFGPVPAAEAPEVESIRRKAESGKALTMEERIVLFDANMAHIDRLQERELKEARKNGTRITRENRGWTREELYEDRLQPRKR